MKTAKNCVFEIFTSAFVGHENLFYTLLAPNMGIQRHPYDHSFAKKLSASVLDRTIVFYARKREAMALFSRWYSQRSV